MACIFSLFCLPSQVKADYYENHTDKGDFCMQAKDVSITDAQRIAWLSDGTLQERLLEKSGLFTNQFHPSDSTRYWTEYDGDYEIDIQALKGLEIPEGKEAKSVSVTFYLNGEEDIFITIDVEVRGLGETMQNSKREDASGTAYTDDIKQDEGNSIISGTTGYDKEKQSSKRDPMKSADANRTQKEGRHLFFWLVMIILALLGYGCSLYSDFKVLRKYKRKLKEREGKE